MPRYGMVIDLERCIGCHACTIACKVENMVPPGIFWNRVYDYESGEYPNVSRRFMPRPCMQCEDPACVAVCPTKASIKREDGIVYVDYDKCLGCRFCEVACPYKARSFHEHEEYYYGAPTAQEGFPYELRAPHQRHVVETASKCNFCMHKIDKGIAKGLEVGKDPEATPACVLTCITGARHFGDLDDPESEVSKLIREKKGFRLLEELDTKPSVYYIGR